MSVTSEINRLKTAKATLKTKLNAKNNEQNQITDETLDEYGDFVDTIQGGGANLQSKSISISTNGTTSVTPDSGYDGMDSVSVTVSGVLDTSDANAVAINIRNSKTAYVNGQKITGTLPVVTYPVNPQNPQDWNYQFIEATGNLVKTTRDNKNYILGSNQIAGQNDPDSWMFEGNRKMKMGFEESKIASISNLTANVLKKDVTVLGVTGTYEPQPNLQDKEVEITENTTTTITADTGYDGLGEVEITTNIGGTSFPPDWTEIGYENTPLSVLEGFVYAKNIYDNWDNTQTSMSGKYIANTDILFFPLVDTSNVTNMQEMFASCTNIIEVPQLNTSKVTKMSSMFSYCTNLISLPVLDTSKLVGNTCMQGMFSNCRSLSDESLNNIMQMCINVTGITLSMYKTLQYTGLPQAKAQRCMTLSNYQAFLDAGWTTGY